MLHGFAAAHALVPTTAVPQFVSYSAVVTGAPNGLDDYPISLTSFQCGLYSGKPSYAGATMGYTVDRLAALNARPDGELVIYQSPVFADGARGTHVLARFNLDDVRYAQGARSSSITISASRQSTNVSPINLTITGADVITIELQANGEYAITLSPLTAWPSPADTLTYANHDYTVSRVDYAFGASNRTLRVTATRVPQGPIVVSELNQAIRLTGVQIRAAGRADELDRLAADALAAETDAALALSGAALPSVAALETDTAFALTVPSAGNRRLREAGGFRLREAGTGSNRLRET